MGGRGNHKDDVFSRHDAPVSMNNRHTQQRPTVGSLCNVSLDLGFRHARIVLERERSDWLAALGSSADSGKCHYRAHINLDHA